MEDIESLTHQYYQTVDSADPRHVAILFADDAIYERPGYPTLHGRSEILAFYMETRVIESGRHDVLAVLPVGNRAAARGTFEGVSHDGRPLRIGWADFFCFRGALIAERTTYFFIGGI